MFSMYICPYWEIIIMELCYIHIYLVHFKFNVMVLKGVNEWGLYIVGNGLERSPFIDRCSYNTSTNMELVKFKFNVMVLKGVNEWDLYIVSIGLERSQFLDRCSYNTSTNMELIQFKFNVMVLKGVNWNWFSLNLM